jgi:flagellar M-ring protein FliF
MATTDEEGLEGLLEDRVKLSASQPVAQLDSSLEQLEKRVQLVKNLVAEDPKRAVQVIKNWMVNEA